MQAILVILLFWASQYVSQTINSSNKITEESSILFLATGYPLPGDIPILNRKIFRGTLVSIREHPYVVSIRRRNSHYLTGTLITKNLVLTVAHPLIGIPVYELRIVVGENYSDRGTSLLTVILVVIHQNFDPYTLTADLAMLRFYEDVVFKSSVKSISLIIPRMPLNDTTGLVTGWGRCDFTGNEICLPRASQFYPDEIIDPMLRTVSVNIASPNLYCEGYIRHGLKLHAGMLCTGAAREEHPSFACSAVPGAPLVVHGKLAGILSWGFGCGYAHDLPLVYTSVQYYTKWIAYNVMYLRKLSKDDLTPLFQATKSYIIMKWLTKTRVSKPSPHGHVFYKNLRQMPFDLEVLKLLGNVYDIRDFFNDGEVRSKKMELYEQIKKDLKQNYTNLLKKNKNLVLLKQTLKTYPFISQQSLLKDVSHDSASNNEYQTV